MKKKKFISLYCPMHAKQLYNESKQIKEGESYLSRTICNDENCEHFVYIENRQAFEQEGRITILLE